MTPADLALLPEPCAGCAFWETGASGVVTARPASGRAQQRSLAQAVTRRWGCCGVVATEDDEALGYLTLAPAAIVPRLDVLVGGTSIDPDAAVLLRLRVFEPYRGRGVGRQLVQSAAGLLVRRDVRAMDAIGSHRAQPCLTPAGFLVRVGFTVVRPHPITPLLRMDLATTARWLPDLSAAWSRLTGLMPQPAPGPEPAHRQAAIACSAPTGVPALD